MKIESKDTDIESLLDGAYFHIPRFQRPYSWDEENLLDFWNDVIANKGDDYFIGSMVVYKKAKQQFGVVDGQQRLTTITILLCVLRDAFSRLERKDLADGLHQLVERKNRENIDEFVLQTESSFPYFQEHIQKFGEPELHIDLHTEELNLYNAHKIFYGLIEDALGAIEHDPTIAEERKPQRMVESLANIRDTLLNLNLIFVTLDSEDDAYLIFETLNTRGKDLAVSDLVKNHFTKNLRTKTAVDHVKIKWSQIMETIHNSAADLSSDTFIYHYWSSRYEALPLKKIFPVLRKRVNKENASQHLDDLLNDSKLYRSIFEPTYGWDKNEIDVARSLTYLLLQFKVTQPTPAVLSLVRCYKVGIIKYGKLRDTLLAIEKFHFLFTAVTSSRSSGGISAMYSSFARKLFESLNSQDAAEEISELVNKLRLKLPSLDEFRVAFKEIRYTNANSKQKLLVRYILRKISEHRGYKYPVNFEELTIEHIAPQSVMGSTEWSEDYIGSLGNLMLLDQRMNGTLGDKSFAEKKRILQENNYDLPDLFKHAGEWSVADVDQHVDELAEIAYKEIWRI